MVENIKYPHDDWKTSAVRLSQVVMSNERKPVALLSNIPSSDDDGLVIDSLLDWLQCILK